MLFVKYEALFICVDFGAPCGSSDYSSDVQRWVSCLNSFHTWQKVLTQCTHHLLILTHAHKHTHKCWVCTVGQHSCLRCHVHLCVCYANTLSHTQNCTLQSTQVVFPGGVYVKEVGLTAYFTFMKAGNGPTELLIWLQQKQAGKRFDILIWKPLSFLYTSLSLSIYLYLFFLQQPPTTSNSLSLILPSFLFPVFHILFVFMAVCLLDAACMCIWRLLWIVSFHHRWTGSQIYTRTHTHTRANTVKRFD